MYENQKKEYLGLSTSVALNRLHDDILELLVVFEKERKNERWVQIMKSVCDDKYNNTLEPLSIFATFITVIGLFIIGNYISALFTLLLLIMTSWVVIRESKLRKTEIYRKVRSILEEIKQSITLCDTWIPQNYPHLCSPLSPCVTLQWTYRDGVILNLPWALIVRGDYIVMRPGQVAPGVCLELSGKKKFKCGETYGLVQSAEPPSKPSARMPLPDLICVMENTPFLENLNITLKNFLNRPPTISNQQRDLLISKCIQKWGFLTILFLNISFGFLNQSGFYLNNKFNLTYTEVFIELTISALLPILPLIFPILWTSINLWGIARIETLLSIPQRGLQKEQEKSFQEDLDTPTYDLDEIKLPRYNVFLNWLYLINGSSELLGRSANICQVLGTITALCCIDKKGILSWPNPTAEKVFFLRDSANENVNSTTSSQTTLDSQESHQTKGETIAEVLDLTHDQHSPFKLEFDDHEWQNHLNSLKPLGLAILVNTCNHTTQSHYAKFCGHVTAVATLDKDLVPVTNRYAIVESSLNSFMHGRCLCELARQIGFTQKARDIFNLEGQISSYRHLQPDVVKRDIRFAKSLQLAAKVKVPFPHSLSVVMRETHSGSLQLLTQGTADIVLDCCDDYWDGKDLKTLTLQERKRAQDFYQRSALTAYCTAFSYRPLRHGITGSLGGKKPEETAYIELPAECKYRVLSPEYEDIDYANFELKHSISTDSLLFSDANKAEVSDVESCYEMQCHQIFIGMVTMQYQAQTDIVQLIERLERACIRFVHFSKENELRSRVFSEKMGLESGWNCHISLLSNTDSSSAPSPKYSDKLEKDEAHNEDFFHNENEIHHKLLAASLESSKNLSSSAPCAISDQIIFDPKKKTIDENEEIDFEDPFEKNCRSLSCVTDSTEQSAPINFDMSNRAKLPRGIENIRPHLENVDNVPLLVSLFTDCSAEATREMLKIMQQYGEIVVCLGSSASNANSEIFLQGDCSIAIEPLYPQVCQDYSAYTESNIYNNYEVIPPQTPKFFNFKSRDTTRITLSPIYLSRKLNSLSCSIAVCRDDPISIVALIELSRRFTNGLWNCVQFWLCCGCTISLLNTICSFLALPPILTSSSILYLMCIAVPLISVSLVRIELESMIMNRATSKKQTINSRSIIFVLLCYGCKFLPIILIMIFSYCSILSHPFVILSDDEGGEENEEELDVARYCILFSILLHFIVVSASFVHRDYSLVKKNPLRNFCWLSSCLALLGGHFILLMFQISFLETNHFVRIWPIVLILLFSTVITLVITEICKWEEIKTNVRYQRRARLDFGTKLGMNSPF